MSDIDDVLNTLSEDELDTLNSDPQMLADFKKKYAATDTSLLGRYGGPAKTTAQKASEYSAREPEINVNSPANMAATLTNFANPFPSSPSINPIKALEGKRQFLEGAGRKVKESVIGSEGNIVSGISEMAHKYLPETLAKAVSGLVAAGGGAAASATQLTPTRPSDFATEAAMGLLGPIASQGTRGVQTGIANRNLQAPKLIREGRYMKGQPTVGEIALDTPKGTADLAVSNKDTMYKRAQEAIDVLGQKIKSRINEIYQKSSAEKPGTTITEKVPAKELKFAGQRMSPEQYEVGVLNEHTPVRGPATPTSPQVKLGGFEQTKNIPAEPARIKPDLSAAPRELPNSIPTKEVANSMDPIIHRAIDRDGPDSAVVRNLLGFKERFLKKNGDFMNFLRGNEERVMLGEDVGKSFNKDTSAIPEITEAQREMWITLRDWLGKLDPELDGMLRLQHDLLDVRMSALPEAAKGFTKTPDNIVDFVKSPFRKIGIADFLGNQLGSKKAVGLGAGVGAGIKSREDKNVRKR